MTSWELLACIILISISACISASEIALFSLSRFQLRYLKENFRSVHKRVKKLLSDPSGLLVTVLVLNEVLNIALTSIITGSVSRNLTPFSEHWKAIPSWAAETLAGTVVTAPILLFFCEITPKVIAARLNQLIATLSSRPLSLIYQLSKPIRVFLKTLVHFVSQHQPHFQKREAEEEILKESEFLLMLEEGHKEGAIHENEMDLIRNVFELDDTEVGKVSTPLSQVISLPIHTSVKSALATLKTRRHSRIPITNQNRKEVLGILYAKDLLKSKLDPNIANLTVAPFMRKPFFVSPTMKLNALFRKFKQNRIHMAIIKDAQNEVVGVVTMSDILDTLFEDFFPESEESVSPNSSTLLSFRKKGNP